MLDADTLIVVFWVGMASLFIFVGALIAYFVRRERVEQERLRTTGVLCTAFVKSYRRVSMTQHRVLFEIQLPTGSIGREYMLSGLTDEWLADVTALVRPIRVYAHPQANTILVA